MPGIAMDDGIKTVDTAGVGGFLTVYRSGIGATPVNIIPDGPGDVTAMLTVRFVIKDSAGGTVYGTNVTDLTPGTQESMVIGISDSFDIKVNSDGSVDVFRTTGTRTYDVNLVLQWI